MQEVIVIGAGRSERHYWLDLWRYRELFHVLAWRYLPSAINRRLLASLGARSPVSHHGGIHDHLWSYRETADRRKCAIPTYGLRRYAAMDFLSSGLSEASNSLINNTSLINKVYFPRLIVPIATIVVAFVDFLISFCFLIVLLVWYRFFPDWRIVFLPIFILMGFFASVGPALWITALNVKYRDFRYIIPFIVQFGLYVSPVGFS